MGDSVVSNALLSTSLSGAIDALVRRPEPTAARAGWQGVTLALRAAAVLCTVTGMSLSLWIAAPALALGWDASAIESGSMGPTIERGDVVVLRRVAPLDEPVGVGSVVRFGVSDGTTVVHRVAAVDRERGEYRTHGDANDGPDRAAVSFESVDGVGRLVVPLVGFPLLWIAERAWGPVIALTVAIAATVGSLGATMPPRRTGSLDPERRPPLTGYVPFAAGWPRSDRAASGERGAS